MIAYDELERALSRWKARRSGAAPDAAPATAGPDTSGPGSGGVPAHERTGEIEVSDVVETYDEAP